MGVGIAFFLSFFLCGILLMSGNTHGVRMHGGRAWARSTTMHVHAPCCIAMAFRDVDNVRPLGPVII